MLHPIFRKTVNMAATISIGPNQCGVLENATTRTVSCPSPTPTASAVVPPAVPPAVPSAPAASPGVASSPQAGAGVSSPPGAGASPNPISSALSSRPVDQPPVTTSDIPSAQSTALSTTAVRNGTVNATTSKDGLTGGAVAGVAIGMLLAGVLIAGAIFFFLLRRQKRRQSTHSAISHLPPVGYGSGPEKGVIAVARAVPSNIDNLLPQPASDDEIKSHVSKIRDSIKNHVRTYCHSAPVITGLNEVALREVASVAGLDSSVLVGALSNSSARSDALRLIVACVILSRTTGGRNATLLPTQLSGLPMAVSSTANDSSKCLTVVASGSSTNFAAAARAVLYSKWKTITGALLQQDYGKNAHDPNRAQVFANVVAELDSILAPFVQGDVNGDQRRKNLDMILTRSANLAFLLFSQPGSFQFEFASRRGGLVAFPALLQTVGDEGQILSPPRGLVEGETVAV